MIRQRYERKFANMSMIMIIIMIMLIAPREPIEANRTRSEIGDGVACDWKRLFIPSEDMRRLSMSIGICLALGIESALAAPQPSFKDVPEDHVAYFAVEYLKEKGIVQGYDDGTFRPEAPVNRAEAVKLIARTVGACQKPVPRESVFTDVPADAWYAPYIDCAHRAMRIIDGPPKRIAFFPALPIKKAEFIKMLLSSYDIDIRGTLGDLRGTLAPDVHAPEEWYFPIMRYALASSMTTSDGRGLLRPERELNRGEVALLIHRLRMYREGRRTQALLDAVEGDIAILVSKLETKDDREALRAANRAIVAVRGALLAKPNDALVKGYVKAAEGFQLVVRAYQAGLERKLSDVLQFTSDAWHLGEKAKAFAPTLGTLASQMQTIAKNMADEARALQKQ